MPELVPVTDSTVTPRVAVADAGLFSKRVRMLTAEVALDGSVVWTVIVIWIEPAETAMVSSEMSMPIDVARFCLKASSSAAVNEEGSPAMVMVDVIVFRRTCPGTAGGCGGEGAGGGGDGIGSDGDGGGGDGGGGEGEGGEGGGGDGAGGGGEGGGGDGDGGDGEGGGGEGEGGGGGGGSGDGGGGGGDGWRRQMGER